MPSDYRLPQAVLVRLLGTVLVLGALLVFTLAGLVALFSVPGAVLSAGVVIVVVTVLATGLLLTGVGRVLRLDDVGYEVRLLRRPGVRRARWKDVEDVVAATLSNQPCVVLRLRDGRTTTLPVALVDASTEVLVRDLREHLDRGHGYRRLG